jgi:hypothetical protein
VDSLDHKKQGEKSGHDEKTPDGKACLGVSALKVSAPKHPKKDFVAYQKIFE